MKLGPAAAVVLAVAISVTLAACGGSSHQPHHPSSASTADDIKFSRCMRGHGLTNFPDVIAGQGLPIQHELDGGVDIIINGVPQPVSAPGFNTAMNACQHYVTDIMTASPGAGITPGTVQHALVQTATCMRHRGVPNYPDPPALGTQQKTHMSPTARARDAGVNIDSPAFKAALAKCGSIMSDALNGR